MKVNGKYLNQLLEINAKHALYRSDGAWYQNLKYFPGVLFDLEGYLIINTKEEYESHPDLRITKKLHIINGISSLSNYQRFTPYQQWLINGEDTSIKGSTDTIRVRQEINRILRDRTLVKKLKRLYENKCQICNTQIKIGRNRYYSEVHHIIPLGQHYNGDDILSNMLCVCPNHHIQLDAKALQISLDELVTKHKISKEFIKRYNELVKQNR